MPIIQLTTIINVPIETCFDLARSIDLHMESTKQTGEQAIAGSTSGLIDPGETVTWRAKHFGLWQTLTSRITDFDKPNFFADEMVEGAFKRFRHEHYFLSRNGQTLMKDIFVFESPLGVLGRLFNWLVLTKYMTNLLKERNRVLKVTAELNKR
jgi:ligand-binding SRPBCC domain-containing protein